MFAKADSVGVRHHETAAGHRSHMAELGVGIPVHVSSLGKAVMAFESPDAINDLPDPLPTMTSATITSLAAFRLELEAVRERGLAFEREEAVIGECSVGAPVIGPGGRVLGAIAVVTASISESQLVALVNPTSDIARAISRELGGGTYSAG